MVEPRPRLYKFDNVKGLLIFLVVVGHLTTDYVSVSHAFRWLTLWIYTFHMPAFIMVSGLLHKQVKELRWNKVFMFLGCGYALKAFLYFFRTAIGQPAVWSWYVEPGIPWYLIVMAEYEILLYICRKVSPKVMLIGSFALSAVIGYIPQVGDAFSLSRMINFLPLFLIGYYIEPQKMLEYCEQKKVKIASWIILVVAAGICYFGPWGIYSMRKWFTGRRSYEFLEDYFPGTMPYAWAIRLGVWAIAIVLAVAIISVVPNREVKLLTGSGARSLSIYFWHRPVCYWLCGTSLYESLLGSLHSSSLVLVIFVLISVAQTALFTLPIFEHPCKDINKLFNK